MNRFDMINDISSFIFVDSKEIKLSDIIFVPGSGFPEGAERAAELYVDGYAGLIMPSGKYSFRDGVFEGVKSKKELYDGEYESEWEFLSHVLKKNRVKENDILKEDKATNTYENAFFSRYVLDSTQQNIRRAIICCKSYHARRCLMFYTWAFPDVEFFVAPVDVRGITKKDWIFSQHGRYCVMSELSKCATQFESDIVKWISNRVV
ncbi:MAG: YdcF family protein [Christensenellales bacterium]|jgi:uncharacterized SAM-binding protein YcdF (DUF218 family)